MDSLMEIKKEKEKEKEENKRGYILLNTNLMK